MKSTGTRSSNALQRLSHIIRAQEFHELVQERRNSIAYALELRLPCTNPSNCSLRNGCRAIWLIPLHWRYNDHDGVSNHQPHGCYSTVYSDADKKKSKLRVTGLCVGNSPGPVNSPHKGPVTRKMFPFDDVIMHWKCFGLLQGNQLHLPSDHRLRCRFHPTGRRPRPGSMPMMKDSVSSPVSVSPILTCRLEEQVSSVSTLTS